MPRLGDNLIAASERDPFFEVVNADEVGVVAPENRKGDALRTCVQSLSGFQKEALVRSSATGRTWRLVSDEEAYLNGYNAAPCPLAFLSTGMAASFMKEIQAFSKLQGLEIRSLKLILDNYYTMQGSMPRRTMVGGAENPELQVEIDCDLDDAKLNEFLISAIYASPLCGLMSDKHMSLFKLAKNGQELPTAKVPELDGPLFPDPQSHFENTTPGVNDLELMSRLDLTPKKEVKRGTAAAGYSLTEEQDRRLNIGAIAVMREDGITELQQMMYSPHNNSFRFLSSEDGRAPDANTLISAGIGFCFMTQFGRFKSILKLDLPDYRIVQDTHFSLGGASGNTGLPGSSDPVETHVYLKTNESDETAQEMLDISEQTCFLHALCRSQLKPILRVRRI
jgi:organic hydroperoxide reductase OsmC/OhrA